MKLLMYSVFLLLLSPCNSAKKATATAKDDNKTVVITYRTSACFGRCPIYTLTISGENMNSTYSGEQNTEKTGMYTKTITSQELTDLVTAFETAKFMTMNEEYMGPITDFPVKTITFTNKGVTKKVKFRSGYPDALELLQKKLTEYANSEGWKKSEDSSNSKD